MGRGKGSRFPTVRPNLSSTGVAAASREHKNRVCFGETEEQSNREERALATPFLGQPQRPR